MKKWIFKHPLLLMISSFLIIVSSVLSIAMAFLLKWIIDVSQSGNKEKFFIAIVIFILYFITVSLLDTIERKFRVIYIKRTMVSIKNDLFHKIMSLSTKEFHANHTGKYLSQITNDISLFERDAIHGIFDLIKYSSSFLFALIALFTMSISVSFGILIIVFFAIVIPGILGKPLNIKNEKYSSQLSKFTSTIKDYFSGFDVIQINNLQTRIEERFNNENILVESAKENFMFTKYLVSICTELIGTFVFVIPMIIGGYNVLIGAISVGTLLAMIQLMNNIMQPLMNGVQIINDIKSVAFITDKFKYPEVEFWDTKIKPEFIESKNFKNSIEFTNVSYKYNHLTDTTIEDESESNGKSALHNLTYTFKKGGKYVVVGESGSGKSTLLRLLSYYDTPSEGMIKIDDEEYSNSDSWLGTVNLIPQDIFIFDASIKDNITLFSECNVKLLEEVIIKSGLTNVINRLQNGIETHLGEDGLSISGGERQRVAIARALYKNAQILLIDEVTSSLDSLTAFQIEQSLLNLDNITTITVTHKLIPSLLSKYESILVLKDGVLVESGSYSELMTNRGYFYALICITSEDDAF